ncbi:MAG: hypothetical protein ABEJ28_05310 [Salinigranum sp.]
MKRPHVLILVLLVVVSVLAGLPSGGRAATVSIANVSVSPSQPNPGEQFTVQTTIQNAGGSSGFTVTDVYVRNANRPTEYARVENVGSIAPGSSMTVPLTMSLGGVGTHNLRLFVVGRSGGNVQQLQYPLLVKVRRGGPQISIQTGTAVVGTKSAVRVSAVNGEDAPIRNLRLTLTAGNGTVRNATRVAPTLPPGGSQSFPFAVTPKARRTQLNASLTYTTSTGDTRSVTDSLLLHADALQRSAQVDARVVGQGASPPVAVSVSNFGNAPLEDVTVSVVQNGTVLARQPAPTVAPNGTQTVQINLSGGDTGPAQVRASYRTGGQSGEATSTLGYTSNPGRIVLTGIDYERVDDRIHITGSASNVGLSPVSGAVLSVVPRQGVQPARPYREYFVGTVPASDFVSFDLYARVDQGATKIPVRVQYIVDGQRKSTVRELDVSDLPQPNSSGPSRGPSMPLLVGGVVAALIVVGIAAYAFIRR